MKDPSLCRGKMEVVAYLFASFLFFSRLSLSLSVALVSTYFLNLWLVIVSLFSLLLATLLECLCVRWFYDRCCQRAHSKYISLFMKLWPEPLKPLTNARWYQFSPFFVLRMPSNLPPSPISIPVSLSPPTEQKRRRKKCIHCNQDDKSLGQLIAIWQIVVKGQIIHII